MKSLLALAIVCLPVTLGCAASPEDSTEGDATAREPADASRPIPFRVLLETTQSRVVAPGGVVIEDAAAFGSLWAACTGHRLPAPALPPIDWRTERVLCIAAGPRPSAGFSIRVDAIEHDDRGEGVTTVRYAETTPVAGSVQAQMISHPVQIVAIARRGGEVRFLSPSR